MKRLLLLAALTAVTPLTMAADYVFDKVHTQIIFSANHLGFSTSTGSFVKFDGSFSFDETNMSKSAVNVTIQTDSIDLNDTTWNSHMKGKKWFDVEQFPTMTFVSKSVQKTGDKTMDVKGDLTLKGVTKPVTLAVTLNKIGEQFGKNKAGFSAVTVIDRTDFGMKTYAPAISAEIPIRIEVEGIKQ
ncbi:MAG: YceI family protein [Cellvibrionaceae bacterium]|nr:YceI family protein [Cellvibrionaceae bacterium]